MKSTNEQYVRNWVETSPTKDLCSDRFLITPGGQIYIDGYVAPWLSGRGYGDARMTLNRPFKGGKLALYAKIALMVEALKQSTKEEIMSKLGIEKKNSFDHSYVDGRFTLTPNGKKVNHYSYVSYFNILSAAGIIRYDHDLKVWVKGPRFDSWVNEVLTPATDKLTGKTHRPWCFQNPSIAAITAASIFDEMV
jgi:hypothetical protein